MSRFYFLFFQIPAALFFVVLAPAIVCGQVAPSSSSFLFDHATAFSALPNGVEISDGAAS